MKPIIPFLFCCLVWAGYSACSPEQRQVTTIGFLDIVEDETLAQAKQGFFDALKQKGISEEKGNLQVIYRNAEGDQPTLVQACDYMISQHVNLIATNTTLCTITAVQHTKTIPIFMMVSPRPDLVKLTDSHGHAPANLLGTYEILSYIDTSMMLIKSVFPAAKRIGTIYNQAEPQSVDALRQISTQAQKLGMEVVSLPVNNSSETQLATQSLVNKGIDAFFALPDNIIFASFESVATVCNQHHIPVFTCEAGLVQRGAVAAFGADMYQWGYQSGEQAANYILSKGEAKLAPAMVQVRRKVYNPTAAQKLHLQLDSSFKPIQSGISSQKTDETPETTNFYISAIILGLALAAMSIGIFISMKIFNIPDITTDGSYTLGAVVTGILMSLHWATPVVVGLSILAGGCAGAFTGFIHTKLKVNALLSGILVMTALYSVNLSILGRSNLPLLDSQTVYESMKSLLGSQLGTLATLIIMVCVIGVGITWLLRTDFGLAMRATGNSESMIKSLGVNTQHMKIIGLAIANGLTAFSGSLLAQYQGFVDINMGIGIVITGLGSVMIGEVISKLSKQMPMGFQILGVVAGTLLFRLILASTLAMGLNPNLLKLVTALLVLLIVGLPSFRQKS